MHCAVRAPADPKTFHPARAARLRAVRAAASVAVLLGCGDATGGSVLPPIDRAALQRTVDRVAKELLLPGAMVIVRTPQGEFTAAYGATERGGATAPTSNDHFRIGSVTKTMTAATILQQAQAGAIRLDDPIAKFRPDVPGGDRITLAALLGMRSGLYNYTADPDFWPVLESDPTRVWTPEELLAIAFRHASPDTGGFDYCNTNTVLLGLVAEQVDRKPLAEIYRDRFFGPLGMTGTQLPDARSSEVPAPRARGYVYESLRYVFIDVPYSAEIRAAAKAGTLAPIDFTDVNPSWAWAAGGVVSTAADLATWIEALVGGRLLDADYQRTWRDSLEPTNPDDPDGLAYGYGIARLNIEGNALFFHNGELPGYNTFAGHDPVNDVTLVVWASLPESVDGPLPADTIAVTLAREIVYRAAEKAPASGT